MIKLIDILGEVESLPTKDKVVEELDSADQQSKYSKYSDDALTDMIVNLSRYEDTGDLIEPIKNELERRRKAMRS